MSIARDGLAGHVALVTGGRRGIGRGIARRLASHGAAVVIAAESRSDEGVPETLDMIRAAGGRAAAVAFDMADGSARAGAVAEAGGPFGPVDILVNNAATNTYQPASVMDLACRRRIFEVNFHGPVDLTQQALPAMRARGWGRVLNIASETVRQPALPYPGPAQHVHGLAVYGATKLALQRYGMGLAAELHGTGIHVNAVYPARVCVTEQNSPAALDALRRHPEWGESVEMMAEAALVLVAGGFTGLSMNSRDVLHMVQGRLHALDGVTVIGDAHTIPVLRPALG